MINAFNKKYKIVNQIGSGKFGIVYKAVHLKTNEIVAVKTEQRNSSILLLKNEAAILKYLYDHHCRSIPIVYRYGIDPSHSYLVMSYYDSSLSEYLNCLQQSISQEKIDKIMRVCIDILQTIHKNWVLHRDIKPDNFMISQEEIFLIDFGFASFYIDEKGEHLPCLACPNIIGTPKYASIFIHEGYSASRRDDLISLGYMYFYLMCRELPWHATLIEIPHFQPNVNNNLDQAYPDIHINHQKNAHRREMKSWENLEPICLRTNQKITEFLKYCYNLSHNETPNYDALIQLFT